MTLSIPQSVDVPSCIGAEQSRLHYLDCIAWHLNGKQTVLCGVTPLAQTTDAATSFASQVSLLLGCNGILALLCWLLERGEWEVYVTAWREGRVGEWKRIVKGNNNPVGMPQKWRHVQSYNPCLLPQEMCKIFLHHSWLKYFFDDARTSRGCLTGRVRSGLCILTYCKLWTSSTCLLSLRAMKLGGMPLRRRWADLFCQKSYFEYLATKGFLKFSLFAGGKRLKGVPERSRSFLTGFAQ